MPLSGCQSHRRPRPQEAQPASKQHPACVGCHSSAQSVQPAHNLCRGPPAATWPGGSSTTPCQYTCPPRPSILPPPPVPLYHLPAPAGGPTSSATIECMGEHLLHQPLQLFYLLLQLPPLLLLPPQGRCPAGVVPLLPLLPSAAIPGTTAHRNFCFSCSGGRMEPFRPCPPL